MAAPKYGWLVGFFATSLPIMHAYMHTLPCSLFGTGRKPFIDRLLCLEKMLVIKKSIKMGYVQNVFCAVL